MFTRSNLVCRSKTTDNHLFSSDKLAGQKKLVYMCADEGKKEVKI